MYIILTYANEWIAFGTDPIGRTQEILSKFAVQEKKRNIQVDSVIETYNKLQDDSKSDLEGRNSAYSTLVNSYYELATLFYEWGKRTSFKTSIAFLSFNANIRMGPVLPLCLSAKG
jgi:hypothetical protein